MTIPWLRLDRDAGASLSEQIRVGIEGAIAAGVLAPGARLPSWRDLAAQLGVARGTVRAAYERLGDAQLIVAAGPAGTRVAAALPVGPGAIGPAALGLVDGYAAVPGLFQLGVPAQDAFPYKLWSRLMVRAARGVAARPLSYADPRGEPALRHQIAAAVAIARGLACHPDQVFVTAGYSGALGLILHALGLAGERAWMEEPGFPQTRAALVAGGVMPMPVPVDAEGLVVEAGPAGAALAVVTPGQQAPLGMALSGPRRRALLEWAARSGAWVIEDDYLGELQLRGRAAPALAAMDRAGRVIHAGTFSKTISPALRLGFVVAPPGLVGRFAEAALGLAPAPGVVAQQAVAAFLQDGHYLRHLRRMKRLYAARRDGVLAALADVPGVAAVGGLAVFWPMAGDVAVARAARDAGLGPEALSPWYVGVGRCGLLLGVTTAEPGRVAAGVARLRGLAG